MTLCIAVAVNDCVVFAADSAATVVQTDLDGKTSQILNVYQHGDKVFNLHKRLPLAAMTCGMGNIGDASIATLAKELRSRLTSGVDEWRLDLGGYTIEEVAKKARKFFFEERFMEIQPSPPAPHSFEFWIGGCSSNRDLGHEIWKISIINGHCPPPRKLLECGATGLLFGGQPAPIFRLINGFDPSLRDVLIEGKMSAESADALIRHISTRLGSMLVMPTMPVRDAIELADFLVETTKQYFRFLPGADIVGGETDIAVVTRYEGFKWIRRKHFYPPDLNPLETDHA